MRRTAGKWSDKTSICGDEMFDEYIGKHLTQRHKYEGLKYARKHGYPELIGTNSYGILFKQKDDDYLVFRVHFDSMPLYDGRGRLIPGRTIKTITEIDLFGNGYTHKEMARAEQIARGYLERVVEEQMNKTGENKMTNAELTEIRESLSLTKSELAKKLDVSPMILGRYEKGSLVIPEAVAERVKGMVESKDTTVVPAKKSRKGAVKKDTAAKVDEKPVEEKMATPATADAPRKPAKSRRKKSATPTLIIQSLLGGTITPEEITARIPDDVDTVYIKPEENKAYWVRRDETGSITLW